MRYLLLSRRRNDPAAKWNLDATSRYRSQLESITLRWAASEPKSSEYLIVDLDEFRAPGELESPQLGREILRQLGQSLDDLISDMAIFDTNGLPFMSAKVRQAGDELILVLRSQHEDSDDEDSVVVEAEITLRLVAARGVEATFAVDPGDLVPYGSASVRTPRSLVEHTTRKLP